MSLEIAGPRSRIMAHCVVTASLRRRVAGKIVKENVRDDDIGFLIDELNHGPLTIVIDGDRFRNEIRTGWERDSSGPCGHDEIEWFGGRLSLRMRGKGEQQKQNRAGGTC